MAAGQAAAHGAEVLLLEKTGRPGHKLRITGKGRCNFTNTAPISEFIGHLRPDGRFMRQAFSNFFSTELIEFFDHLGVPSVVERGGRVFPESGKALDVVRALVKWAKKQGVVLKPYSRVSGLISDKGRVKGVSILHAGRSDSSYSNDTKPHSITHMAEAVIITTGGASYPATGSTGDGYALSESAGHKVIPARPALIPLVTGGGIAGKLMELNLRNVKATTLINNKKASSAFGEMLFTHFGVSGPIILGMSGPIVDELLKKKQVEISIDLKPSLNDDKLDARLIRELDNHGKQHFKTLLKGLLPMKLIPVCIDLTGIPSDKSLNQITGQERGRLRRWLKDFRLPVSGFRPISEAIITAGGVDVREIDPRTMGSQIIEGLYFAGEVLDMDGDTGGYNLQTAFSTGWLAGRSAACGSGVI